MDRDDLRLFAARDWDAVQRAKRDYWAAEYARVGSEAARRASTILLAHAQRIQPGFPADSDRADDLAHHLAVRQRLDRASRAFARR